MCVLSAPPPHTHTHTHTGDQILDIHGMSVSGLQVAEVVEIIKKAPDQFLATVRPITALTKGQQADTGSVTYSEIVPQSLPVKETKSEASSGARKDALRPVFDHSPTPSLEDVGNYDDEDEGDTPPPLPPRTEDALILVDPPPDQLNGEGGREGGREEGRGGEGRQGRRDGEGKEALLQ